MDRPKTLQTALNAAFPFLVRHRLLDAVERGVRESGGPCTSALAMTCGTGLPFAKTAVAFCAIARKVAELGRCPDSGRLLVRCEQPDGSALWWVDARPHEVTLPLPAHLAERLELHAGGELGGDVATVLATIVRTALDAIERRPEPRPAPERHEPAPGPTPPQEMPVAVPEPTDPRSAAPVEAVEAVEPAPVHVEAAPPERPVPASAPDRTTVFLRQCGFNL